MYTLKKILIIMYGEYFKNTQLGTKNNLSNYFMKTLFYHEIF